MRQPPESLERQLRRHAHRRSDREILIGLAWIVGLTLPIRLALFLTSLTGIRALATAAVIAAGLVALYHEVAPLIRELLTRPRADASKKAERRDHDAAV